MNPYPEYKNSGLPWLGKIPKHWQIEKLKFNARVRFSNVNKKTEEGEIPVKLCNYVDVYYNSEIGADIEFMAASASLEEIKKFQLKAGDVLITKDSEEWTDIAVPAHVAVDIPNLLCGYHLAQIRSGSRLNGDFLFWLLSSNPINYQFKIEASGVTRYGLSNHALDNSLVLLPPVEEQKKLVDFLKTKTAQIDDLILIKEKIIDLLKEELAATINQAVTKGLNPKVELKNSGLPWLGKIPKHWEMKKLKYVGEAIIGLTYSPDEVSEEGTLVLRSSNVQNKAIVLDDKVYVKKQIRERLLLRSGDILICSRNGSRGLIGKCAVITASLVGNTFGAFMTVFRSKYNRFIYHIFNSTIFAFHIESFLTATINQLTSENLNSIVIPFPPPEEQAAIARFLEQSTLRINLKIQKEARLVELLQEHRAALISEVVTGKIDVREI